MQILKSWNREIVNLNVNVKEKSSVISQIKTTYVFPSAFIGISYSEFTSDPE